MVHVVFVLAVALCITVVQSTPFKKCEGLPSPTDIRIHGCDELPCKLYRGKNCTAEWDFIVTAPTKKLTPKVTAYVLSTTVVYPFGQKDACETLVNGECPLDKGEQITYYLNMPVLKIYPPIKLNIQFEFFDDNNNVQVCFVIPAKVV